MSTTVLRTRKLSSFVKCGRCRQDRQKCERPNASQQCVRCAKFKHDCDAGRASNRAQYTQTQRTQKPAVRRRAAHSERTVVAAPSTTQHELLATGSFPDYEQVADFKIEESSSSRTSRSASSELSIPWSIPSVQDGLQFQYVPSIYSGGDRHGSASSDQWASDPMAFKDSPPSSGDYGWETVSWTEYGMGQEMVEYPGSMGQLELSPVGSDFAALAASFSPAELADMRMLSGLTSLRPSRQFVANPFEERLDNRINRLWGNYKTFASASLKGLGVTPLFGRTLSELFRQSRQMAENGDDLVADVRMCCGAADACMNTKLSAETRAQYLSAYTRYDARANAKYRRAVDEFAQKIAQDESPDVLPLYTATFLYYAAGSCMRGSADLVAATYAFNYFNQYTAGFPIRLEILPTPEGTWAVDMLLANNKADPGMRINTLMFALGRARLQFDREDGLC